MSRLIALRQRRRLPLLPPPFALHLSIIRNEFPPCCCQRRNDLVRVMGRRVETKARRRGVGPLTGLPLPHRCPVIAQAPAKNWSRRGWHLAIDFLFLRLLCCRIRVWRRWRWWWRLPRPPLLQRPPLHRLPHDRVFESYCWSK